MSRIVVILLLLIGAILLWLLIGIPLQSRQSWHAERAALVAKGEKLALADFLPPPVRDAENFFADPIWQELADRELQQTSTGHRHAPRLPEGERQLGIFKADFQKPERDGLQAEFPEFRALVHGERLSAMRKVWQQAEKDPAGLRRAADFVLRAQQPGEALIARLRELARRPDAVFPLEYSDGILISMDHVTSLLRIAQWLNFRGKAQLELGNSRAAFGDAVLIYRFREALRRDGLLISTLVEAALTDIFTDLVDLGVRRQAWTPDNLLALDHMLAGIDMPARFARALRMERALMLDIVCQTSRPRA